jgi:hypothetical protein
LLAGTGHWNSASGGAAAQTCSPYGNYSNWRGPSCYRAASRIALTCWTDGLAEPGADDIGGRRRRSSSSVRAVERKPPQPPSPIPAQSHYDWAMSAWRTQAERLQANAIFMGSLGNPRPCVGPAAVSFLRPCVALVSPTRSGVGSVFGGDSSFGLGPGSPGAFSSPVP